MEKTSSDSEIDTRSLLGHNLPIHSASHLHAVQLAVVFCILQCNILGLTLNSALPVLNLKKKETADLADLAKFDFA